MPAAQEDPGLPSFQVLEATVLIHGLNREAVPCDKGP